jgi:hypothetical protein
MEMAGVSDLEEIGHSPRVGSAALSGDRGRVRVSDVSDVCVTAPAGVSDVFDVCVTTPAGVCDVSDVCVTAPAGVCDVALSSRCSRCPVVEEAAERLRRGPGSVWREPAQTISAAVSWGCKPLSGLTNRVRAVSATMLRNEGRDTRGVGARPVHADLRKSLCATIRGAGKPLSGSPNRVRAVSAGRHHLASGRGRAMASPLQISFVDVRGGSA